VETTTGTRVWRIGGDRRLEAVPLEEFHRSCQDPESCLWVDIAEPTPLELEKVFGIVQLHPLALERCLDPLASSGALLFENHVLVQVARQQTWADLGRRLLSIVCLPGAIVTIHPTSLSVIESIGQDLPVLLGHHRSSPSSLTYLILDRLVDASVEQALEARRRVDELEETLDGPLEVDQIGEAILGTKRKTAHLEITLEEQHRCLTALMAVESEAFSVDGLRHYFRDTISHVEHSLRYVEAIEARLAELHQQHLLVLQDRTSSRLKLLTILSAVFMPLTLITGIYGMNFRDMPELGSAYGYPLVLVVMLSVAGGLLWFFYRKGWFD
jgi:magnesium transporter